MDKLTSIVAINIVAIIFIALAGVGIPTVMLYLCGAPVDLTCIITGTTVGVMWLTSMIGSCAIINLEG